MRAAAAVAGASAYAISFRVSVLPWAESLADNARFKRIRNRVLIASALLCLLFLLLPKPQEDRTQVAELPPQLAKIVLERERPAPPPPPAPVKAEKKDEQVAAAHPKKPDDPKPETVKRPVPEARNPKPNKAPGEEGIRRKAAGVGLLAMKDQIAEIRGAPVAVQLNQEIKQGKGVGTGVGPGVGAGNEVGIPVRALITSNATNGSGGINTAAYSRNTGGGGLAGRATTLVEGVAGGGGGGGAGGGGVKGDGTGAGRGGTLHKSGSGKASRSIEEIKLVFERNKGAIYALYNRALRDDPSLQGKVVVELKIAPSGEVVDVRVLSSELKASELERKLLARIKGFDFGSKDVDVMVVSWPVDFLPS
ncbi:MAG TPA: AgmX/PglI C-terminal domain-containing protein [Burkholderiaceae bacterium]|nr:AgmX/PglI C-terminal domain-containing protein [Burkholderiaceae bacterium]